MTLCLSKIDSGLGISTCFSDSSISKYEKTISAAVEEFSKRANQPGQFLNWVDLPKNQLARLDEIYSLASSLKSQTNATKLTILGIGGSKHTVENMLSLNGLNLNSDEILFYSDIDSVSFSRFLYRLNNDVTSSNYMVASKSGSTFETKDGFLRIQKMLEEAYSSKGYSLESHSGFCR
jgi:glucose-6-phosphate isomerase